jgi:hypothetical protein
MKKTPVKFPYGISNFEILSRDGYIFVDKTHFIEILEAEERYSIFLRPRRFGKSLFISILEYYYDINQKHKFNEIFANYYIGKHPTPKANAYRILKFDFSGIDTQNEEITFKSFLNRIQKVIETFIQKYKLCNDKATDEIISGSTPAMIMNNFFEKYKLNFDNIPIFLLIDEYDHFTNEILIRDLKEFKRSVSQDGYIRKFYETLKIATQQGFIDRFFITGVSPITLDSLTSGFNIGKHLSLNPIYHDMMGFRLIEVQNLLNLTLVNNELIPPILLDLQKWYNGYKFSVDATESLFNPDMILYFLDHFKNHHKYPLQMLDPNIMPDYSKIMKLFHVANYLNNIEVLEQILENGKISCELIYQFNFEQPFDKTAFVNLLFYLGNLTLDGMNELLNYPNFVIPNYVIARLFWQYYALVLQNLASFEYDTNSIHEAIVACAYGNIGKFFQFIQILLEGLSNRDYQKFNEKYVKAVIMSYLHHASFYYIRSEREIGNHGYVDLEILQHPNKKTQAMQYAMEIKYLKQNEAHKLNLTMENAKNQLKNYVKFDKELQNMDKIMLIAVVIVKDKIYWEEVSRNF